MEMSTSNQISSNKWLVQHVFLQPHRSAMATTRYVQLRQPRDPTLVHMYQQGMCWKYASSVTKLCFSYIHNMSQNYVSCPKLCFLKSSTSALSEVSWQQHLQLQAPVSWVCLKVHFQNMILNISQKHSKHFTIPF